MAELKKIISISIYPSELQKVKEIANLQQISLSKLLISNTLKNEN